MIKCACGKPECKGRVFMDSTSLWLENDKGVEVMIYLDPNAKVALIRELQESLLPK